MTENEAIERLQTLNIILTNKAGHKEDGIEKIFTFSDITAICTAIQALEEIQQIKEIISDFPLDCGSPVEDVREIYRQFKEHVKIGTIEEFQALKEKSVAKKPLLRLCGDCQRDCVDCDRYENRCPTCNGGLYVESGKPHEHCPHCGQKLDSRE